MAFWIASRLGARCIGALVGIIRLGFFLSAIVLLTTAGDIWSLGFWIWIWDSVSQPSTLINQAFYDWHN
jgi:hypothetical protein